MSEQHSVMPAIFIGHGSPGNILEDNPATRMWESLASEFDTPKGIVCVSAHWYIKGTAVTANENPRTHTKPYSLTKPEPHTNTKPYPNTNPNPSH